MLPHPYIYILILIVRILKYTPRYYITLMLINFKHKFLSLCVIDLYVIEFPLPPRPPP